MKKMKMMKFLSILLALSLVFLAACSNSQSGGSESQGQSGGDSNANADQTFVLKTTIQTPPAGHLSKGFDAYLDEIEEKSNGRIKFERYYSESLVKSADVVDALSAGIADVGVIIPALMASKIPLSTIGYTSVAFENSWAGAMATNELYQTTPELNDELAKHNIKFAGQLAAPSKYVFSVKPIESIADMKGKKIVATGEQGLMTKELGATPVSLPTPETFEALQRGTVDGAVLNLSAATTFNIEQVAPYVYKLPYGGFVMLIGMNKDLYNALPDDLKQLIQEVSVSQANTFHEIYQTAGDVESLEKIATANGKVTEASEADIQQLREITKNLAWSDWVNKNGGTSAQAILDKYLELTEKYENENPYKDQ